MLTGQDVTKLYTLKSWNDNNYIEVIIDNEPYRLNVSEVVKLLNAEVHFNIEEKRKHKYLTIALVTGE